MSRVRADRSIRTIVNDFRRARCRVKRPQGSLEKEMLDGKRTDGLSHAPPPRESRKRLVSRFKCPGIYWVGQIQRSWPLPRPSASPCTYYARRHIDAEYDGSPRSRVSPSLISQYAQPPIQFSSAGKPLGPRDCSSLR